LKTGNYLATGLGQNFHALKQLINEFDGDLNKLNKSLRKGRQLNSIRNRTAHPELITKDDLNKIREIIIKLHLNAVFDELISYKRNMGN
jgi:hypothetical protein